MERHIRGAMYDWGDEPAGGGGLPFKAPAVNAAVTILALGAHAPLAREVTFRTNDQAIGEGRRAVRVVPAIDVRLDPDRLVWSVEGDSVRSFLVTLTSNDAAKREGLVRLEVPGWRAPAPQRFSFEHT